jgi:hypothetical protein
MPPHHARPKTWGLNNDPVPEKPECNPPEIRPKPANLLYRVLYSTFFHRVVPRLSCHTQEGQNIMPTRFPQHGMPLRPHDSAAGGAGHGTSQPHSGYTNFPTVLIAGHTLMLRRNWPEDLIESPRRTENPLLLRFGTEGEIMTVNDAEGQTVAALWVRVHRNEPLPESGSAAWPGALSSLRTAMRYSRMGWLEVGPIVAVPALSHFVAALVWQGLQRLIDRNGLGFAIGLCIAPPYEVAASENPGNPSDAVTAMLPLLLERHGLDPEFAYRPHKFWRPSTPVAPLAVHQAEPEVLLPPDLREALRRGAKLCGEPALNPQGEAFYFWALARV